MTLLRVALVSCATVIALGLWSLAALGQIGERKNLLPNPSFEVAGDGGLPVGWDFRDSGAGAKATLDNTIAHSGRRSIKLTNPHGHQPHVYGTLFCAVRVKPSTTYTFSLYALSDAPGGAWFGGGPQWERRQAITPTGGQWRRFSLTFRTGAEETVFEPRINVDSQTEGLWIDDVQLEEGDRATDFTAPVVLQKGESHLSIRRATVGENLLRNGSFEELEGEWPAGWRWDKRNTQATMTVDDTRAHSGRRSVKLTNPTPFGPHVYGQLLYADPVQVKPNTQYTISAYVLVESPGIAWVGGAAGWRVRAAFPSQPTGGQWVCVKRTWITNPDETEIRVMVITESPTAGVWVDDVKLEEGPDATPFVLEGDNAPRIDAFAEGVGLVAPEMPWMPDRYPPDKYLFASSSVRVAGHVLNASGGRLHARLLLGGREAARQVADLPDGICASFEFVRDVTDLAGGPATVELWVEGAAAEAKFTRTFELVTAATIDKRLAALEPKLTQLEKKVAALSRAGGAYPLVTLTTAQEFARFIRADARNFQLARAWAQLVSVEQLVDKALRQKSFPSAPKYLTSPVEISGSSFIADVRFPDGSQVRRPVIFIGMGPFGQARADVEKFPGYGFNIMQVEFGPNSVLPSEDSYSDGAINEFRALCERAEKAGVAVNLLISPHYFPDWARRKWPHLNGCGGGFVSYCIHAPESRAVLEKFLRYTIPRIRDLRALHSICLSNEPILTNVQNCPLARANWHAWLQRRHGAIEKLNQAWGTQYASFEEIPVPPALFTPAPIVYDFVRYNQEEHAAWHQFMADIIHELAPHIPVHAKMMICAVFGPSAHGPWSVAPELFAPFCQINGNDAWRFWSGGVGEWASAWQDEIMGYELQRCAREAPVFNSEDHIIPDRNISWQPPEYIYNVYWQGAVHGRGASSAWVWERSNDLVSDFTGSILHRPECVEAAGRCTLDLNRLAREVTALQQVKPQVAVVYALSGFVWDSGYPEAMAAIYRAGVFGGYKIGFVYERQLEAWAQGQKPSGYLSDVKVIVCPGLRHLSARAQEGLAKFAAAGGKVFAYLGFPEAEEYNRPLATLPRPDVVLEARDEKELVQVLRGAVANAGVALPVQLLDADGNPTYGIEYFAAPFKDGWLINISNYRSAAVTVRLRIADRGIARGTELISGQTLGGTIKIPSLQPLLIFVR